MFSSAVVKNLCMVVCACALRTSVMDESKYGVYLYGILLVYQGYPLLIFLYIKVF